MCLPWFSTAHVARVYADKLIFSDTVVSGGKPGKDETVTGHGQLRARLSLVS
jgi:hypothetical protein